MTASIPYSPYSGPVQAVILDWAGTAVDYGCMGPAAVFVNVFEKFNIRVGVADARQFMGLEKKEHVRRMFRLPEVISQWREKYNRLPDEDDVNLVYAQTESLMVTTIANHADPIQGLLPFVEELRRRGIKIGSCTGYTASMMEVLVFESAKRGYTPDCIICSSDVPAGRPYPWMCYQNAIGLQVYPLEAIIKIGDTISDVQEGLNAGMWTIGLTQSGNELGLPQDFVEGLPPDDLDQRLAVIEARYHKAGAHYVVRGIWECLPIVDEIARRLANGEHPLDRSCMSAPSTIPSAAS
jgi:phosphonoacetaldehyde hydrolase